MANETSYTNTGLDSGITYYYRVLAYNSYDTSSYSNEANTTIQVITDTPAAISSVVLGQASHFAVLAGGAISTVPTSAITGDIGVSPAAESYITGFSQTDATGYAISPQVTGFIYAADMANTTPAMLTQAKGDLTIAYNDAAGRTPVPTGTFLNPGVGNLAGLNLVPGLYKFTGEAIATTNFTLTGGANDVWIFQIASALNISNGVQVILAGGAQAKNIFWQVGTSAILGTTVNFYGTIMADQSITMQTGAKLNGRALARIATVALDTNIITLPDTTYYISGSVNAPSNLVATVLSLTSIGITWTDNSANEYGFKIGRKKSTDTSYILVHTTAVNETNYINTGLDSGVTYYYRVSAYDSYVNSSYSNEANTTTLSVVNAPSNLAATVQSISSIKLTWTDNSTNELGFKLERSK